MNGTKVPVMLANGNPVVITEGGTEDNMREEMLQVCSGPLPLERHEGGTLYTQYGSFTYMATPDEMIDGYDPDDDDIDAWQAEHDGRISRRGHSLTCADNSDTAPSTPPTELLPSPPELSRGPDTQH